MPKINIQDAPVSKGSSYPPPFDEPCKGRSGVRLGIAGGLTQFGVNLMTLEPGAWSSQRHWHQKEDELVYVLSGALILVENDGEQPLVAGECVAWKAGERNGHHLVNRSSRAATFLAIGTRDNVDWAEYPDIDLRSNPARYEPDGGPGPRYSHNDGTPYPG